EVLHDHGRLRKRPAVLFDDRHAAGRVLSVDPGRPVVEIDLDRLELDALLAEDDPHPRAIGAARRVVQRDHASTPMIPAIRSYSSCAGGSSAGDGAVGATSRPRGGP